MKTTRNSSAGKRKIIAPYGIVLFIVILFGIISGQKTFGQGVGISETSIAPDPSSILELKWTSGPFKGFLVPRLTTANRLAIVSPAQGLLVYDTTTKSFWYYDGGWKAVMGAGSLGSPNQLLGMDATGTVNEYKTLNGSANITVGYAAGNIYLNTIQDIHSGASPTFTGLTLSSLTPNSGVYTNGTNVLTSAPPISGILGYWSRFGSILSPSNPGDAVTTSGNIYTSGGGTITSAGLLTGSSGITVTGAASLSGGVINLNNNSSFATNINTGTSAGSVTIGN